MSAATEWCRICGGWTNHKTFLCPDAVNNNGMTNTTTISRVELAELIKEKAKDCEFSMPFFLMGCLVDELKRVKSSQGMNGTAVVAVAYEQKRNISMKVERTSRTVIEHKLLTALEDGGVAAILSQQDLEDLVCACKLWITQNSRNSRAARLASLRHGMEQLLKEAFE